MFCHMPFFTLIIIADFISRFQYCFAIMYRRQNQRQYELRAETTSECQGWIEEIKAAR